MEVIFSVVYVIDINCDILAEFPIYKEENK